MSASPHWFFPFFRLQTVQEAELELMMLQQTHEKVVMQQEAARVARELDQQQLLALLQQQQHAAQQEQVSGREGLGSMEWMLGGAVPCLAAEAVGGFSSAGLLPAWHMADECCS